MSCITIKKETPTLTLTYLKLQSYRYGFGWLNQKQFHDGFCVFNLNTLSKYVTFESNLILLFFATIVVNISAKIIYVVLC
mgnify:CR=1 FL=1